MKKDEPPIVIEQTYNTSINDLWDAITKVDVMRQWFFENIPSFKARVGFKTQFSVQSNERTFIHLWQVKEVLTLTKIAYNWKYDTFNGDSRVEFELFEKDDGIKLKLTHYVLEDFPDDIPEFRRESAVAGWQYFINQRLKEFLDKGK